MSVTSRRFAGEADYAEMRRLVIETVALGGDRHLCTAGDLDWWNAQRGNAPGSARDAQLWFTDAGELVAFAWPGKNQADFIVHPLHRSVIDEMLTWGEEGQRATTSAEEGPPTFSTYAFDGDTDFVARLRSRGYQRLEDVLRYRRRSLDGSLPTPPLLSGYTIRNLAGEDDLERRVAVHRAAFAPSRMTVEKHRAVMASPTYRQDLDLFAVAPDGSFASYCIVWFDAANRMGLFEPVGTHPDHQRRGLGKAVLAEGLRRLKALGAQAAFVNSIGDANPASNALYESLGFRLVDENHAWKKTL